MSSNNSFLNSYEDNTDTINLEFQLVVKHFIFQLMHIIVKSFDY